MALKSRTLLSSSSNIAFFGLHETLQNQPKVKSHKCEMQGCQWYGVKLINNQNDYKFKHLKKVYFDVCDLKLEIRICFDTVFFHFYGVTFKNMSNKLKIFNAICAALSRRVSTLLKGLIRRQQHNTPLKQKFSHCAIELPIRTRQNFLINGPGGDRFRHNKFKR